MHRACFIAVALFVLCVPNATPLTLSANPIRGLNPQRGFSVLYNEGLRVMALHIVRLLTFVLLADAVS